jgi:hypothetical protein
VKLRFKKYSFTEWKNNKDKRILYNAPEWWIILNGFVRLFTFFRYSLTGYEVQRK